MKPLSAELDEVAFALSIVGYQREWGKGLHEEEAGRLILLNSPWRRVLPVSLGNVAGIACRGCHCLRVCIDKIYAIYWRS